MRGIDEPGDGVDNVVWLHDPACDDLGGVPAPCTPRTLAGWIAESLGAAGLDDIEVTGVVRGVRRRRACTFELVEEGTLGERDGARLAVVVLPARLAELPAVEALIDGALASVSGALAWDAPWASLRLVANEVSVGAAVAASEVDRRAAVERLRATGVFEAQRRLAITTVPWRVGLLAGDGTAGAEDVEALLGASKLPWTILRRSVPMAGGHAPAAIVAGIAALAEQRPDVIVAARGGGARSEFACWDDAGVVQAIAGCSVPVWTALGHAADHTLADEAAHTSFSTPSAVASALVARAQTSRIERSRNAERRSYKEQVEVATHRARIASVAAFAAMAVLMAVLLVVTR